MNRAFKFRHVNEIVGSFTIVAGVMLVVALYIAGRAQGWFEGSFRLHIVFDTPEGAFGLQEGAEVQVRNTPAGRIGRIYPNDDGHMQTTVSIRNRFQPFVHEDSIALIKLRFGIAGDAYVDISRGTGPVIADDGIIKGAKDEEILDIIGNAIAEAEAVIMPILAEVRQMLEQFNTTLAGINDAQGVAGALIFDPGIKSDVTATVAHIEHLTRSAAGLMTNAVPGMAAGAERMTMAAEGLLTNDVQRALADLQGVQAEAAGLLRESRRLVEGIQRHWLLRRYVPVDDSTVLAVDRRATDDLRAPSGIAMQERLGAARRAADHAGIARLAYEQAVLAGLRDQPDLALDLIVEAKLAHAQAGDPPVAPLLIEARIHLDQGRHDEVETILDALDTISRRAKPHALAAQIELLRALLRLAQNDFKNAQAALDRARLPMRRAAIPALTAAHEDVQATLHERRREWRAALASRARQVDALRAAGLYLDLAAALESTGHAQFANGMIEQAAYSWLSAAASFAEQDADEDAARCRELALRAAMVTDCPLLHKAVHRYRVQANE